jgi:hypothetical protein
MVSRKSLRIFQQSGSPIGFITHFLENRSANRRDAHAPIRNAAATILRSGDSLALCNSEAGRCHRPMKLHELLAAQVPLHSAAFGV